nr:bacterial regulatory helix-turn-helix protein, lysR family [uncultured bacterium]AMP54387.1 bacterial regulatory helix-turn-helix protein, lysR family [uncultured bacterium]
MESDGFSRATQRLGVSKSIVSRRIARIEAEFGTQFLKPNDAQRQPDRGRDGIQGAR